MGRVVLSVIDGTPLKLNDDFSNFEFDIDGFMVEFDYKGSRFRHYNKNNFKVNHAGTNGLSRYYNEKKYLDYIQDLNGVDIYEILKEGNWFNFKDYVAPLEEPIEVEYLDFKSPYLYYYKKKKAAFKVELDQKYNTTKKYKDILKQELIVPSTAVISNLDVNLNSNPRGFFFKKNLAHIDFWTTVSDEDKKRFARLTTLTAFQIKTIVAEVFPKILTINEMVFVDETRNNDSLNLDHLNLLQQIVFSLKKSWGYYLVPGSNNPHQNDFETILPQEPIIEPFIEYYSAVTSFYKGAYKIQDLLLTKTEEERIYYLLDVLPATAFRTIPYQLRLKLLNWLLKKDVDEVVEVKILKIVFSITNDEADDFLDFLLSKENGINTLFEIIFQNMDDKRLYRYPIVSWFESEENNRMYFVKAIYELWKVSKYPFIKPDNALNTQSYFLNEGSSYCFNAQGDLIERVFEYGGVKENSTPQTDQTILVETVYQDYKSDEKLDGVLINFYKSVNHNFIYTTQGGGAFDSQKDYEEKKKLIKHHLYQSLTLYGYSPLDIDLIPNGSSIPAFLLYYTDDFKRLQRIDAAYSLAIEVGIEVVLFFALGGTSALRHLRHLKHITKLDKAIRGTLAAEETVLVWRGVEATSEVISLKASLFMSLANYNATVATTEAERKRQQKISQIFLWITLAFAGGSIYFRRKAVKAADELIREIDALPPGTAHNIPADVIDVLRKLKTDADTALTLFRNELNALEIPADDIVRLVSRYDQFTLELKRAFYNDFKGSPKSFWAKLSKDTAYLDNWKTLFNKSITDRLVLDVITSNKRVTAIVRYYDDTTELRKYLEPLSYNERWSFLDEFGSIGSEYFEKFIQKPDKIKEFSKANELRKHIMSDMIYHWLHNDFSISQLQDLYEHLYNIRKKIVEDYNQAYSWIKNYSPTNKEKSLKYLGDSKRVTVGIYIEKPAIDFIKRNLQYYEEGFVSVDIKFYDNNNKILNKGGFRDIDGLIFNKNTGKFESIKSCKFPVNDLKTLTKPNQEIGHLLAYGNIPLYNNSSIKLFFQNNDILKNYVKDMKSYIDKIHTYKMEMINVKTGEKIIMEASEFQQKIKLNYNTSDVLEINQRTLGTTHQGIIEGTYQYLNKKYNQPLSWD